MQPLYKNIFITPNRNFAPIQIRSDQISHSVVSDSFRPHESQHTRPPCPSPAPGVHSDSRPSSRWYHPAISSPVVPFSSCPQSLPESESFSMSQLFAWGGQSTGVSALASFLPKKSQGWSPSEWTARRSNQSILKEISPGISLEGMTLKLKLQYFGHLMGRVDSLEKTLMLGGIGGKRRRGRHPGWDGWMASLTWWTWVWVNSGSWWWTGRPGVLWFMGLQRVGHDWATDLIWFYAWHSQAKLFPWLQCFIQCFLFPMVFEWLLYCTNLVHNFKCFPVRFWSHWHMTMIN